MLLGILGSERGLTEVGKEHVDQVNHKATSVLDQFARQFGDDLLGYFVQGFGPDAAEIPTEEIHANARAIGIDVDLGAPQEFESRDPDSPTLLFNGYPGVNKPSATVAAAGWPSAPIVNTFLNVAKGIVREAENQVREDLELPRVGEGWIGETQLFNRIRAEFPEERVIAHGRPGWLAPQHLDVYLPDRNIALEYQGLQHYEPVDFFGGEAQHRRQLELDERKRGLCQANDCVLLCLRDGYDISEVVERIRGRIP